MMRNKWIPLWMAMALFAGCSQESSDSAPEQLPVPTQQSTGKVEKSPIAPENKAEALVAIEGMVCPSCQHTIQEEVLKMPGVASCEVSLENKDARLVFDKTKVSVEDIIERIQSIEEGAYQAQPKPIDETGSVNSSESTNAPAEKSSEQVSVFSQFPQFEIPNLFTYFLNFIQ